MKFFARNKKGDLSLSVNAIVIIIIAITVLGLALVFVRGMFGQASSKISDVFDSTKFGTQPTTERPLTLTPSEPEIKSNTMRTISVAFLNKFASERYVTLTPVGTDTLENMKIKPIPISSSCKKLAKGDSTGWSVPITALNTEESKTSIITFIVTTYSIDYPNCDGEIADEVSEDLVLTVIP